MTYWLHRLYHTPWLYKNFHKAHHKYIQPTAFSVTAIHPVEIMHIQLMSYSLPMIVVPCHWCKCFTCFRILWFFKFVGSSNICGCNIFTASLKHLNNLCGICFEVCFQICIWWSRYFYLTMLLETLGFLSKNKLKSQPANPKDHIERVNNKLSVGKTHFTYFHCS